METKPEVPTTQWLTLRDLCRRWHLCDRTVRRIPFANLPYYNLPGKRRYRLEDVTQYERARLAGKPTESETEKEG